ncbi:hypothetical protein AU210_016676 [Fusarium oxysporum f. sp. radicis-cucumerinum]|uniref:Uncharacterized protein n=2 Tax=Fusarium oxysporum TaxID=5507 RepID=A0A2H3FZN7_FUSOX|nr:hypothetical protein AU210_016676 [Fusarium oxysporum f. sp. radicis-cucumerinum]RKK14335.1 hypothetical protein BFJ65_g10900 [Fusarium oxysporum f. sp. cepae]RKK27258.1 hypothetical protein BFJ67_g16215 [Fusarium oxysporum f. sp. cepae]RKK32037.1 hypothetical protein BFJ66_g15558 [Fusarium oxysporum f. sp. cepae]
MAPARQAPFISKWSLRAQDHNATRVRDNQRRHRARVKARIESLETGSRQELRIALARIEELEALVAARDSAAYAMSSRFKDSAPEPFSRSDQAIVELPLPAEEPRLLGGGLDKQGCCHLLSRPVNQPSGQQHYDRSPAPLPVTRALTEDPTALSSIPADQTAANPVVFSLNEQYDHDGRLPLVAHGESTNLCRVAYEIIAQQNMAGIEMSDVEEWLWLGFRRATKQGEGCRVDTKVLYALIDYMSPL